MNATIGLLKAVNWGDQEVPERLLWRDNGKEHVAFVELDKLSQDIKPL